MTSCLVGSLFWYLVTCTQILPPLQRNRHIAVFPDEIVEGAETEFFALLHARVGEEFHDLQLADLIGDGAARTGGKRDCLLARGLFVHWDFLL